MGLAQELEDKERTKMSIFEQIKDSLQGRTQLWNGSLWDPAWFEQTGIAGYGEMLSLKHPDIIKMRHRALLEAGADAIATNTFGATASVMKEHDSQQLVSEVNFESARLACAARDEFPSTGGTKWVIGSMGPTFNLLSVIPGAQNFDGLEQEYHEQAKALWEGGVDLLHIERCQDPLNLRAALLAIKRLENESQEHVPLMITMEVLLGSTAILEITIESFLQMLKEFQPIAFGIVLRRGVALPELLAAWRKPPHLALAAMFDAFEVGSAEKWFETPESLANKIGPALDAGAAVIGIGIGAQAEYVRALRARLDSNLDRPV